MPEAGIFCLEGEWDSDLRIKDSVQPLLELLETVGRVPSIRKEIGTKDALDRYLRKWVLRKYADFPALYLATHGEPGHVVVGGKRVSLARLATSIGEGGAKGRCIYFGSCSTLFDVPEPKLKEHALTVREFVRTTGVRFVAGFREDVDWLESAAFDLILLPILLEPSYGPKAVFDAVLETQPVLAKRLGFTVITRNATYVASGETVGV